MPLIQSNKSDNKSIKLIGGDSHLQQDIFGNSGVEKKSSLGNKAKSSSIPSQVIDFKQTGILIDITKKRYDLQDIARHLFIKEGKKYNLKHPMNYHRTSKCLYLSSGADIKLMKSKTYKKAFYSGLQTCGCVWTCPVCAAKIQERRRIEVAKAMDWHYGNGEKCVMLTFTFPHKKSDNIVDLLEKQRLAFKYFRSGRAYKEFRELIGYIGLIRSLEIVHSERNGYHPHTHELWLVNKFANADSMLLTLKKLWLKACIKAKLIDRFDNEKIKHFNNHAVDIKDKATNSDYLNKMDDSKNWGADREIAKASTKNASFKGQHPYSFLTRYDDGSDYHGKLWIEYAKAFKGKAQLFWTRGLKDLVGIQEMTDEQIAEVEEDMASILRSISDFEWDLIRTTKGGRINVKTLAETGGKLAVDTYIKSLKNRLINKKQVNKINF